MQAALEPRKSTFGIGNLALIIAVGGFLTFLTFEQSPIKTKNTEVALLPPPISYNQSDSNTSATALADNNNAQVLGAATYNKDYVNQLNISVRTVSANDKTAVSTYAQQLNLIYNTDLVGSGEAAQQQKFLNDVAELGVPVGLVDYQKLLIRSIQLDLLQKSGQTGVADEIASLSPQLDTVRGALEQTYGFRLP